MYLKRNGLLGVLLTCGSMTVNAKTDIEFSVSALEFNLTAKEKGGGPEYKDDSNAVNFSVGAYRNVTDESAWGVVAEYSNPLGRSNALAGNGSVLAIRPINWRYQWSYNLSSDLFFGAAKYDWEKAAIGYYAGAELSYAPRRTGLRLGVQIKYFHDLTYDTSNGDLFVNGASYGVVMGYKF